MSDGANLGIGPDRALHTILGGEPPPEEEEGLSREAMQEKIYAASQAEPASYEECGWICARIVLEYLEQHPDDIGLPPDDVYDWERFRADGAGSYSRAEMAKYLLAEGLFERIRVRDAERAKQLDDLGLTDFLWGWGYNAAHHVLALPTAPNPAIVEIG